MQRAKQNTDHVILHRVHPPSTQHHSHATNRIGSTLQSGGIRLLAGNKDFLVHRSLLARHLPQLAFSSRNRYIELDTEDEESVGYLLEFLYTGDYSAPGQQQDHPPQYEDAPEYNGDVKAKAASAQSKKEDIYPVVLASRTSGLGIWGRPKAVHTNFSQTPVLPFEEAASLLESSPEQTLSSDYPHPASISTRSTSTTSTSTSTTSAASTPSSSPPPQPDIARTFLTHARIYLLADRYAYTALQTLSLGKLRAALKAAEIERNPLTHTVKLVREIYELDLDGENNGSTVQALRDLVVAHVVARLAELQACEAFVAFVTEGGAFVGDLLGQLVRGGVGAEVDDVGMGVGVE